MPTRIGRRRDVPPSALDAIEVSCHAAGVVGAPLSVPPAIGASPHEARSAIGVPPTESLPPQCSAGILFLRCALAWEAPPPPTHLVYWKPCVGGHPEERA